jgi:5-methylcytosine-specific restriction endonuclease McrA
MAVPSSSSRNRGEPLNAPVLILNRNYQPVRVTTARQGFVLLYSGRARALDRDFEPMEFEAWIEIRPEGHDEAIGTPRGAVRLPRVLVLASYSRVPRGPLRLSRRNIFLRDNHTCQYCARRLPTRHLNLDHVIPRSRGGRSTWENLVTSCRKCNLSKGWATPEECGMPLQQRPRRPTWTVVAQLARTRTRYEQWAPFLGGMDAIPAPPDE